MSGAKKSVDEVWKELNVVKPKPRQGVAGLAVGLSGLPGITSVVRIKPAANAASTAQCRPSEASASLVDGPHRASEVGEDAASYLATLQRTINCLADPDRSLRRSAATALQTKLFTGDTATPRATASQLQALLCGPLLRPLVTMLSDSVERCRTIALAILLDGGRHLSDTSPLLPELVPELARRFGTLPVQEPAEELRLQIAHLTAMLLATAPPAQLVRFMPDLAAILCRSLEDGFPDIKKTACGAIETAAARLPPASLEAEAEKLIAALAPNLQHQHSRVRLASIQALDAMVAAGAPLALVEGSVATALRPVGHDRAQPVREAAFAALARWMGYRDARGADACSDGVGGKSGLGGASTAAVQAGAGAAGSDHRAYVPALLPLLIIGVTDPQPATADLALRLVKGVGDAWVATGGEGGDGGGASVGAAGAPLRPVSEGGQQEKQDDGDAAADRAAAEAASTAADAGHGTEANVRALPEGAAADGEEDLALRVAACLLGPPYHGRPGPGCRAMVRDLLPQHLPPLVRQLGEWTVALRVAAARGLHTTLVMAEDAASAHLRLLLPALCSAIADDEVEVATRAVSCVHVLGAHVSPADWLPRILDTLSPGGHPPGPSGLIQVSSPGSGGSSDRAAAGSTSGPSTLQRTQALVVLSGLLYAAGRARRELPPGLLSRLAGVLAEDAMLAAAVEHPGVRQQLLAATLNLLAWGGGACADVALPLHLVLLLLYGSELAAGGGGAPQKGGGAAILDAMSTLAGCCGAPGSGSSGGGAGESAAGPADGPALLAARHCDWLVAALFSDPEASPPAAAEVPDAPAASATAAPLGASTGAAAASPVVWRGRAGDATWQCVLRAVLLTASPTTLGQFAPALVSALGPVVGDKERDASLRLALLQVLDGVLEDQQRGPALAKAGGQALITEVLMAPLVWQAGKTAAAVRYAAVTALATLLGRRLPDSDTVLAAVEGPGPAAGEPGTPAGPAAAAPGGSNRPAAPDGTSGLLPLLFSTLDEDWYTDMRLAACYVVEQLLGMVGPRLSDASRRALYPELHKRLDDAHNSVRVAACGALRAFVETAGPGYCSTNTGYLVAGVTIHMDDGDTAVQEAACSVLLAAAATKPSVTAAEVRKVRDRFRSKHYCDRVLAACEAALLAPPAETETKAGAGAGVATV